MHELAVTQCIVDQVAEHVHGRRVRSIQLEIGKLSGVVPDSVRFCFDLITVGTSLEGSALVIGEPDGLAHCARCGGDFPLPDLLLLCPCGSADVRVLSGTQLLIKSVKVA
jgi:hydrogenase nickel incorporation protein HypA/HybF